MNIRALKLNSFTACCLTAVILGYAFQAYAADDTAAPAKSAVAKADDAAKPAAKDGDAATKKAPADVAKKEEEGTGWSSKAGAALWAQDCRQCHNIRSPSTLSGANWENAMAHMRFRCNLTAKEYRKIAAFMQASAGH